MVVSPCAVKKSTQEEQPSLAKKLQEGGTEGRKSIEREKNRGRKRERERDEKVTQIATAHSWQEPHQALCSATAFPPPPPHFCPSVARRKTRESAGAQKSSSAPGIHAREPAHHDNDGTLQSRKVERPTLVGQHLLQAGSSTCVGVCSVTKGFHGKPSTNHAIQNF